MKVNRFFAAILSVALCMNFAACSNDENDDINPDNAKKRLVKVVEEDNGWNTTYDFGYDEEGRVVSIYADYANYGTWCLDITYSGNQATAHYGDEVEKWTLDDDGNIVAKYDEGANDWYMMYTYTGGYMAKRVVKYTDGNGRDKVKEADFVWKDGLLGSMNGEPECITYTKIPNMGNLCVGNYEILDDYDSVLRKAGLLGKNFKMLPDMAYGETFEYELDKDGYVKTAKLKDGYGVTTYTFTYEEIK